MPKSKSLPLLLANLLFFKEWRASRSLQKSDRERFAQVAHDKRAKGAIRSAAPKNEWIAWTTDERIPYPAR